MNRSKLTRRALALRLFALTALVNLMLLGWLWPAAPASPVTLAMPKDHVEIWLKGVLHARFEPGLKVMLVTPTGSSIGSGLLVRQEESGVVLWLPDALYRDHHRSLVLHEWALLPHIEGATHPTQHPGGRYEIAY